MRAMQVTSYGQPLELCNIDLPQTGPDQVLVKIHACGLNFGDLLLIKGTYQEKPELPFTLGMEISGTIVKTGANVLHLRVGQKIAAYCGIGGLADFISLPASVCVPVPQDMPDTDIAAFLIAYGTSHVALDYKARLQPNETLLVLGASGGIGMTAVELGKLMGAKVIACAGGPDKMAVVRAAGADHVIDSKSEDIRIKVKELGGADVVYDPVGGAQFTAALRSCNPEARLIPLGFASGEVPQIPANIILVKNLTVIGYYWGGYTKFKPQVITSSFQALFDFYRAGKINPHVSHVLELENTNDGLDMIRNRSATGKVVIKIS